MGCEQYAEGEAGEDDGVPGQMGVPGKRRLTASVVSEPAKGRQRD